MERKNKKMLLVLGVLLLLGGISFAYFVGTSLFEGTGSKTEAITASIKGATVNVEGGLTFNDLDILPGHQTVSSIKVTATGNNELIPYNLIWSGTNSLNTPLEFKVYKTSNEVDVSISCDKKTKVENGYQILNEECSIFNLDKLGSVVSSGTIETATDTTKVVLASDEFITVTSDGMSVYYYVILEYPNLDEEQNEDMGGNFNGTVTVKESNAKADINILAVKIEQEDGTYQDSTDIPQGGYIVNTEKSVCSNGATPGWDIINKRFYTDNLTKKGTSCYLYFDKYDQYIARDTILVDKKINEEIPDFNKIATTDEGIYKTEDDDGISYYWRGAVENNYIKFADKYWRIIRINGDGTIRIIYDGREAHTNGTATTNSIVSFKLYYSGNNESNSNEYVGFTYSLGSLRGNRTKSNALQQLESWYKSNISQYEKNISKNAGFCNDRTAYTCTDSKCESPKNGGGTGTTTTYYGAYLRLSVKREPNLTCNDNDLYTVFNANKGNKNLIYPIGMINADEVTMAGASLYTDNNNYYLYNGQEYWTMTPLAFWGNASMLVVWTSGGFNNSSVSNVNPCPGLRPVINLRSDVKLTGTGTINDPYVVVGEN